MVISAPAGLAHEWNGHVEGRCSKNLLLAGLMHGWSGRPVIAGERGRFGLDRTVKNVRGKEIGRL